MNVAILCGYLNSPYARDILRALNARGLSQINVVAANGSTAPKTSKGLWATHGWRLPYIAMRWVAKKLVQRLSRIAKGKDSAGFPDMLKAAVQTQGGRFVRVGGINGEECCQALQALQVDLMILGGVPIVCAPVLKIPRVGTINAHQGALPRFRGMNVIEWALLHGCPPTISIHFVDPGVDTGDIIATEMVPIAEGDTLSVVRTKAGRLQSELLARITSVAQAGPIPRRPQRQEDGRQYYAMHPRLRAVAEQQLQEFSRRALGE